MTISVEENSISSLNIRREIWRQVIFGFQVNSANAMGDYFRAKIASESAKRMSIISLIIGCVAYVCLTVYFIFMVSLVRD